LGMVAVLKTHFVTASPSQPSSSKTLPLRIAAAVFAWHLRKSLNRLVVVLPTLISQTPFVLSAVRQPASSPPNGVQTAWATVARGVIARGVSRGLRTVVIWPPPLSPRCIARPLFDRQAKLCVSKALRSGLRPCQPATLLCFALASLPLPFRPCRRAA